MIFYTLLVIIGSLIAGRLILGELRKERRDYVVIIKPTHPTADSPEPVAVPAAVLPKPKEVRKESASSDTTKNNFILNDSLNRIHKLEQLLAEKNTQIVKLQTTLEAERRNQAEFEKIKSLLQWQIFEARQMNKEVKRELDTLMAQGQKFQDEALRLQAELNYKEQLLNQNEVKLSELKNRLKNVLSAEPAKTDDASPSAKTDFDLGDIS